MANHIQLGGISVSKALHDFMEREVLPGSGLEPRLFWETVNRIVHGFGPRNRQLLAIRDALQSRIDTWHRQHRGEAWDQSAYERFLRQIGYLLPVGPAFNVTTDRIDPEISSVAGPQLVVPVSNARYAINAANARWGSLYDAYYGTDALGDRPVSTGYDEARGRRVIAAGRAFLDAHVPLAGASYADVVAFACKDCGLVVSLRNGGSVGLADAQKLAGYRGDPSKPEAILFRNNGLHVEVVLDRGHPIGQIDPAGIADIVLEAALTTICDLEDSIAAVDPADKVGAYRNWLGLMKGDIAHTFEKGGRTIARRLASDRVYTRPDGTELTLPGRSLLLVRNVGHLMEDRSVLDRFGHPVMEGLLDGLVTTAIALHDLRRNGRYVNSRAGSIYIVKPKMHGPEEVRFANELFAAIEDGFGLERNTIKMGMMDEERRTSVNLKECIRAAKDRVFFINTGFLDRTGDEIRTSMEAGAMVRKADMRSSRWIQAYENRNVEIGLRCGLPGHAQIGKGMWAMPDMMAAMLDQKRAHPGAGADTAWVPSPTAAVLHATHYHAIRVRERQAELSGRPITSLSDLLTIPVAVSQSWTDDEVREELENNAQGILGYVVRWIDQGIGCSKVPDINDVGLMEDRATLRISSQHIANWLHHGVCSKEQVMEVMKRMAVVVDRQNADDPAYRPMAPDFERSIAFAAACDLVFKGVDQPNGYTELILHARRLEAKASLG